MRIGVRGLKNTVTLKVWDDAPYTDVPLEMTLVVNATTMGRRRCEAPEAEGMGRRTARRRERTA
jgi:hypothetical protein